LKGTPKGVALSVVYAYNVYLVPGGGPAAANTPAPPPEQQMPLNEKPLKTVEFDDPAMEFGTERCYVVRSVDRGVESAATAPVCVMPVDRFAPPAPAGLAAVASEGAVSLIWEGVEANDLAGYIVLRADGPDGALQPLFETPIRETAYRDASARPGTRYVYAVAAADTAKPRNVSAPSNRVEESAR
jgi:fibronectin type 3 domain-containing protein